MSKRIQRKRTKGWKMPANTYKRHTTDNNLCLGPKVEKKNIVVCPVTATPIENLYRIAQNPNTKPTIAQNVRETTHTDEKDAQKHEMREQSILQKTPRQEKQETNEPMKSSEDLSSKISEGIVCNADSLTKEHSTFITLTVKEQKNANNLVGNITKLSPNCQNKNLKSNSNCFVPTATPVRVQRKRTKGFKLREASPNGLPVVYVGRPTRWGNPFPVGSTITLRFSLVGYRYWLTKKMEKDPHFLDPLKGKDLACWCPLNKPCHADILLELLEAKP